MNKENILTCKAIMFYARKDEDALFEWIKRIECIDDVSAAGDELYLHVASVDLHDHDLRDLLGLFQRYNVDMKQLARLLTDENKHWFYDNKISFWHDKVFGEK